MTFPVHFLADYLTGEWRIVRLIRDYRSRNLGRLRGTASIAPFPGGLCYIERGELRLGSYLGEVGRRYRIIPEGDAVATVQFADGRAFYRLDLSTGRADVVHFCGDDRYRGRYLVLDENFWTLTWSVVGPRKSYVMSTGYVRSGVPPRTDHQNDATAAFRRLEPR